MTPAINTIRPLVFFVNKKTHIHTRKRDVTQIAMHETTSDIMSVEVSIHDTANTRAQPRIGFCCVRNTRLVPNFSHHADAYFKNHRIRYLQSFDFHSLPGRTHNCTSIRANSDAQGEMSVGQHFRNNASRRKGLHHG